MLAELPEVIAGLEGIPIAESAISFVDGQVGRLEYRGIDVEKLVEHCSFEEVCFLLLFGKLPSRNDLDSFNGDLTSYRRLKYGIVDLIKCLPETGHPMDALQAATAAVGMFYLPRHSLTPDEKRVACIRMIAKTPTLVAAFQRLRLGDDHIKPRTDLSLAGNFLYMMTGNDPNPQHEKILDTCLILHADHTMNASTFSGRVVGSTGADPYCVVSSALGALSGPLHGGANEDAMALFDRIGSPEKAKGVMEDMIKNKQKTPGFGHRVYKTMDPRAKVLKKYAEQLAAQSGKPHYAIAVEVEKTMVAQYGEKGIWPNVDLYSGIVYNELGIPRDCYTPIFAMARVPGWLAHWLEQMENNRIYRPTQKYIGKHNQPCPKITQR